MSAPRVNDQPHFLSPSSYHAELLVSRQKGCELFLAFNPIMEEAGKACKRYNFDGQAEGKNPDHHFGFILTVLLEGHPVSAMIQPLGSLL